MCFVNPSSTDSLTLCICRSKVIETSTIENTRYEKLNIVLSNCIYHDCVLPYKMPYVIIKQVLKFQSSSVSKKSYKMKMKCQALIGIYIKSHKYGFNEFVLKHNIWKYSITVHLCYLTKLFSNTIKQKTGFFLTLLKTIGNFLLLTTQMVDHTFLTSCTISNQYILTQISCTNKSRIGRNHNCLMILVALYSSFSNVAVRKVSKSLPQLHTGTKVLGTRIHIGNTLGQRNFVVHLCYESMRNKENDEIGDQTLIFNSIVFQIENSYKYIALCFIVYRRCNNYLFVICHFNTKNSYPAHNPHILQINFYVNMTIRKFPEIFTRYQDDGSIRIPLHM
ncbi:hypothetical protein AGLY_005416 [Aphis glycines]|uniref:Uncharacterized protein n=1 Tax=Aphis glycines TaxID=307491 RepID=A0A6G0TUC7_APHGL|nr:hypothetical protein AGLY_005416 [Aphis glycines]